MFLRTDKKPDQPGKQGPRTTPKGEDIEDIGLGKNLWVNGIYRIGKTRVIASYGQNRDALYYGEKDIDTWSLGAKYDLTDKSELFAAYVTRDEGDDRYNTITVGVNAKFGASIW